jgi:hypothetical protein
MWVRLLKIKDETCAEVEAILLEVRHMHDRFHSVSCTFALVLRFNSDSVFEGNATRHMHGCLGVGVQHSAPYAYHMLRKAERLWRTIMDNASAMMHTMFMSNSLW